MGLTTLLRLPPEHVINVKNIVYHTVVRLTVIKQQISFVAWPSWGSLTSQLTSSYK